jgi:hypothetical protein
MLKQIFVVPVLAVVLLMTPQVSASAVDHSDSKVAQAQNPPGVEDTRACVTYSEWGRTKLRMARQDAEKLLDGRGTHDGSTGASGRWYRVCGASPNKQRIFVVYSANDRVRDLVWMVLHCYPDCYFVPKESYTLAA